MEMLGVMFAGMAIQRVFNGLIKTSMEWMGVSEILSVALGILFLPIAEFIQGVALDFLNWVSTLTEEQKKWFGIIVLGIIIFGGLLFIIGQLFIGFSSIVMALSGLGIIKPIVDASSIATGATAASGFLKTLKLLGGLAAIGISIKLAWDVMSAKGPVTGLDMLKSIGAGLAAGIGAFLLGVSLPGAIIIGGLVATVLIAWRFESAQQEFTKAYNALTPKGMVDKPINIQQGVFSRGTRQFEMDPNYKSNFSLSDAQRNNVVVSPVYNINVLDKAEMQREIKANNNQLVESIKRLTSI
jgi:hypothetical protein